MQSAKASVDPKLDSMTPREVSYWLALIFSQNPVLQQALLEVSRAECCPILKNL